MDEIVELRLVARGLGEDSWELEVDNLGRAVLVLNTLSSSDQRTLSWRIPSQQLLRFEEVVNDEDFFSLGDSIGRFYFDHGERRLTISTELESKTVVIATLRSDLESRRVARIWHEARSWFTHEPAVNFREEDWRKGLVERKPR